MLATAVVVVRSTIFPLSAVALVAATLGLLMAWVKRAGILPQPILYTIAPAMLALLFYPTPILSMTLTIFLDKLTSSAFTASVSGLALVLLPRSIALAFFLFSLILSIEPGIESSRRYLKNVRGVSLWRVFLVATSTLYHWYFRVVAIIISLSMFQATMKGTSTSAVTLGGYFSRHLDSNIVSISGRALVVTLTALFLLLFTILAPLFCTSIWRLLILMSMQSAFGKRAANLWLSISLKQIISGCAVILLGITVFLHLAIVARLVGILPPPFESGLPAIDVHLLKETLEASLDASLIGSLTGSALTVGIWASLITKDVRLSSTTLAIYPLLLGMIAFFPSSFLGAVILATPLGKSIAMFLWGLFTSATLSSLLAFPLIVSPKATRYDNVARLGHSLVWLKLFFVEYRWRIISLAIISAFFVATDLGFHQQYGENNTISGVFVDRQGSWGPGLRLMALSLCAAMFLFVSIPDIEARKG